MTPAIARKLNLDGVDGRVSPRDFGDVQLRLPFLLDARRQLDDGRTTKLLTAPAIVITCAIM